MSAEMDAEIRRLPLEDLIQGLRNLEGMRLQLGDAATPEESREMSEAYWKLSGFVSEKVSASMRERNPI